MYGFIAQRFCPWALRLLAKTDPTVPIASHELVGTSEPDLPIAVRKGTRTCTKHPLYPLSSFVSYERLSSSHKSFLTHLNTISIPKTLSEALKSEEWKQAMRVESKALF